NRFYWTPPWPLQAVVFVRPFCTVPSLHVAVVMFGVTACFTFFAVFLVCLPVALPASFAASPASLPASLVFLPAFLMSCFGVVCAVSCANEIVGAPIPSAAASAVPTSHLFSMWPPASRHIKFRSIAERSGSALVRQRVQQHVDADRVARPGKGVDVLAAVAFAFERVAEIGVVGAEDEDAPVRVRKRSSVRHSAVGAALRGASARAVPEVDRGDLRKLPHVVEHVEDRVVDRH